MTTDFDIAICGAGPVGLALAALLAKRGVPATRIALLDAKTLAQTVQDPRSIALSYGSRQILEQAQAWPIAATPIEQIHVSRRGHFGRTLIDCSEQNLPALGYVSRYGAIVAALGAVAERAGVSILRPLQVSAVQEQHDCVLLQCADERSFSARIVVQAEGGVFAEQTARALRRDYDQIAIIAHVTCSAPVAQRAFERFTEEGPLALLPQEDGYALVWCARQAAVERLLTLNDQAFLAALQQAFGHRLGLFRTTSARQSYPLGLNAYPASSARIVAIGNAAQTLHPVAGQGLNLGLRDATVLAQLLAKETSAASLSEFHRTRRMDRSTTIGLTDGLARVFASASDGAPTQTLLGLSLALLDVTPAIKGLLAQQMVSGYR